MAGATAVCIIRDRLVEAAEMDLRREALEGAAVGDEALRLFGPAQTESLSIRLEELTLDWERMATRLAEVAQMRPRCLGLHA